MTGDDAHVRVVEKLSAYLEGELPPAERTNVDEHLRTCIRCRTALERLRRTLGSLAALKRQAPRTFLSDIQQQIHRRSRGRFFRKRWLLFGRVPFEWISLVMIIAMLLYYIVTLGSTPTNVAPTP